MHERAVLCPLKWPEAAPSSLTSSTSPQTRECDKRDGEIFPRLGKQFERLPEPGPDVCFYRLPVRRTDISLRTVVCQQRTEERRATTRGHGELAATPADDCGRFFWRGPLQSGVLQHVMQTELSLPVQNCW